MAFVLHFARLKDDPLCGCVRSHQVEEHSRHATAEAMFAAREEAMREEAARLWPGREPEPFEWDILRRRFPHTEEAD